MNPPLTLLPLPLLAALVLPMSSFADDVREPVLSNKGKITYNGLLQTWLWNDTTAAAAKTGFRLRRAEMKVSGSVADSTRWVLMIDPAKTLSADDGKVLQDAIIGTTLMTDLELLVGQFKTPTTAEGLDSSAELLLPERSMVARAYGDKREPGAMLTYKFEGLKFSAMVGNGKGPNTDDDTTAKDLNLRAEVAPIETVRVGLFTTAGDFGYGTKARWGASTRFAMDAILALAEYVEAQDAGKRNRGWAVAAGYTLLDTIQPAARFETLTAKDGVVGTAGTVGVNYLLSRHNAKFAIAYSILADLAGNSGTPKVAKDSSGGLLVLGFQASI